MYKPTRLYAGYIFDLDGTVYLGNHLLPTAPKTIHYLRQQGKITLILSNNPTRTRQEYARKLTDLGVDTSDEDVINSSYVMVKFLQKTMPGASLFVVGEESLRRELESGGFVLSLGRANRMPRL